MKVLSGRVVGGHIELERQSEVAEGSFVTVLVADEDSFTLSEQEVAALQESIREADRGDMIDGWELLRQLPA